MAPAYSEKLMDHFRNPRNVGVIEDADAVGKEYNPSCGDTTTLYLKIEGDTVTDAKFQTLGCGAAIATSSAATELIIGGSVESARKLTREDLAEAVGGLPPVKVHCSVLATDAIKSALKDYKGERGTRPSEQQVAKE